jgi:hypothetical protein
VLAYYGLTTPAPGATAARVSVVRPALGSNVADFEAGNMVAATRTQFLYGDLIERIFAQGHYRLVPIRDHEALARAIPGARASFIPPGLYGPDRRIPAEPVPTLSVTLLLVARRDLPGRVARDILEAIYDPRFARDLQSDLTEDWGRKVAGLPLHPAADIYYHRNDLVTSDRLGRISFVASGIAALVAAIQFFTRFRRSERIRNRRRLSNEIGTGDSAPGRSSGSTLSEAGGSGLAARPEHGGSERPESSSPSPEPRVAGPDGNSPHT